MVYRTLCVVLIAVTLAGCGKGQNVVTYNKKSAAEWAKDVETGRSDARNNGLSAISEICKLDPTQIPHLTAALKHSDSSTRMTAVLFLKQLGAKAAVAVPDLQALVATEGEDALVKKEAEAALAAIQPAAPVAPAAPAANADPAKAPAAPEAKPL